MPDQSLRVFSEEMLDGDEPNILAIIFHFFQTNQLHVLQILDQLNTSLIFLRVLKMEFQHRIYLQFLHIFQNQ
ncbi:hypothetical protein BKD89_02620 [Methanomethylophilus alvi]|uniref:Uncharacterized protein n=1 Tax=Methanomethylophilus alvi TaxID=1291540 RepID=A0A3G3IG01_9ARCH|nr:hypothetical protein BKD89_02620 [Methanomethylophilus alvi]